MTAAHAACENRGSARRNASERRRSHRQPHELPRLPAHAGAGGHGAGHPRRGAAIPVGRQPAALAHLRARGRSARRVAGDRPRKLPAHPRGEGSEYDIYPPDLWDPYRSRRYKCGEDLYATIGVAREDKLGRLRQFARNYQFFGAPVGLFFCIDRRLGPPQWSDLGMYMQSVMLLAREHGLHTCAQEAWSVWHRTVGEFLRAAAGADAVLGHGARLSRRVGADQPVADRPRAARGDSRRCAGSEAGSRPRFRVGILYI